MSTTASTSTAKLGVSARLMRNRAGVKYEKVETTHSRINFLLSGMYGQLKEVLISLLYVAAVLALYKYTGLHALWIQCVEKIMP